MKSRKLYKKRGADEACFFQSSSSNNAWSNKIRPRNLKIQTRCHCASRDVILLNSDSTKAILCDKSAVQFSSLVKELHHEHFISAICYECLILWIQVAARNFDHISLKNWRRRPSPFSLGYEHHFDAYKFTKEEQLEFRKEIEKYRAGHAHSTAQCFVRPFDWNMKRHWLCLSEMDYSHNVKNQQSCTCWQPGIWKAYALESLGNKSAVHRDGLDLHSPKNSGQDLVIVFWDSIAGTTCCFNLWKTEIGFWKCINEATEEVKQTIRLESLHCKIINLALHNKSQMLNTHRHSILDYRQWISSCEVFYYLQAPPKPICSFFCYWDL